MKLPEKSKFFISCPLGFEDELLEELKEIWPFLVDTDGRPQSSGYEIIEVDKGGVEIRAPFHLAVQLNYFLKTANRILFRLDTRKVKEMPDLKKYFKALYLSALTGENKFALEVSCQKSKINNEKKVAEVFSEVFNTTEEDEATAVYIRFNEDLCSVSLDTSGKHLHFRSPGKHIGEAPLRESIAAYCLRQMLNGVAFSNWKNISWIDPVVGSGTFLLEAKDLHTANRKRKYSFETWPITPKVFNSESFVANYKMNVSNFKSYQGYDSNPKMLEVLKHNWQGGKAHFQTADLFALGEIQIESPKFVIMNPPYGDRIKSEKRGIDFVDRALEIFKPQKLGVILPLNQAAEVKKKFRNTKSFAINHGGLATEFLIIEV